MSKETKKSTEERNRKAAAVLRTLDKKELEQVNGGLGVGGGCPTCGYLISVE